jgi:hypothetical protein
MCREIASPKLISVAAEFLYTEKAPKVVPMSDVGVADRPCDSAAYAIRSMLAACQDFPDAVKQTARKWERDEPAWYEFLRPCQEWWKENQERIVQGRYNEVTAPQPPARGWPPTR